MCPLLIFTILRISIILIAYVDSTSLERQISCMTENNSFTFPKSLTPALIVATSILIGLLGGANIISNGVVEANRFQIIDSESFFDSATGGLFIMGHRGWEPYLKGQQSGQHNVSDYLDKLISAAERGEANELFGKDRPESPETTERFAPEVPVFPDR